MAVPRKAISQKNSTGHCSGVILRVCTTEALAEFFRYDQVKAVSNPRDHPASTERYRYRLEGNGHPGFAEKLVMKVKILSYEDS